MFYQTWARNILWGIIYAVFALPLVPDWFIAGLYVKKEMLFQVLIELGVVALVASGLIEERGKSLLAPLGFGWFGGKKSGGETIVSRKEHGVHAPAESTRTSSITWALFVFVGATALSTIFSIDPFRSFWGTFFRFGGLFTLTHLAVFFFILRFLMERHEQWHKIFSWILGINVCIMLIFFLQKMGMRDEWFLERTTLGSADLSRPGSTLDNPAFFAGYLMVGVFCALFQLVHAKSFRSRIMWGMLGILQGLVVMFTLTRAAFLGLVFGMLLFLGYEAFLMIRARGHAKKYILGSVAIAILILGLIPSLFQGSLGRLSQLSISANQNRIMAWEIALTAAQEHPLIGWGPENFYVAFNKYFNPQFIGNTAAGNESWFDRAHNNILDILVATGVVGLLAYMTLLFALCRALLRKENRLTIHERIILGALLAAYLVEHMFIFDVFSSLLMFMLVGALLEWSAFDEEKKKFRKTAGHNSGVVPRMLGAGFLVLIIIYFYIFVPSRAAGLRVAGDAYRSANIFGTALSLYTQAFQTKNIFHQEEAEYVGNLFLEEQNKNFIEFGVTELERVEQAHPLDARAPFLRGTLLLRLAEVYTGEERSIHLGKAREALLHAHELSPSRQQIYFALAEERMVSDDITQALAYLQEALALNLHAAISHWNLGLGYIKSHNLEGARIHVNQAVTLNPGFTPQAQKILPLLK